jgi:hypothetical protein
MEKRPRADALRHISIRFSQNPIKPLRKQCTRTIKLIIPMQHSPRTDTKRFRYLIKHVI